MRIAMISEHASPLAVIGEVDAGGQNLHVAELATALAAHGHQVRVYTRRDGTALPDVVEYRSGVTVEHVPAGPARPVPKDDLLAYMDQFGRHLADRWRDGEFAPDVVHAHFWMSGLAGLRARAGYPVPLVLTYHALGSVKRRHQGGADTSPPGRIRDERMLGNLVDRVVAQCADEAGELVALGVPPSRIARIPSGVDTRRFSPDGPAMRRRSGRRRVLAVGRLVERKGYADLVEALRDVPGAELVIVGGPPVERLSHDPVAGRLRRLAARAGVADRVLLAGGAPRAQVPAWYRSADVVACPAWYEPFGLTPLEAMACGVPVVAYAVGGFTDTIAHGRTGLLVPPRDRAALAGAIDRLTGDEPLRRRYAHAGVARVHERYRWSHTASRMAGLYHELASRTGARRPSRAGRPAGPIEAVAAG